MATGNTINVPYTGGTIIFNVTSDPDSDVKIDNDVSWGNFEVEYLEENYLRAKVNTITSDNQGITGEIILDVTTQNISSYNGTAHIQCGYTITQYYPEGEKRIVWFKAPNILEIVKVYDKQYDIDYSCSVSFSINNKTYCTITQNGSVNGNGTFRKEWRRGNGCRNC